MSKIIPGITVLIICLILATLPMAICAKSDIGSQQKVISETDNRNTIYIKEGQTFIMKLRENPSTGYSWQLSLNDGLNLLWDKYHPWDSSGGSGSLVIGAGGFHLWKIKAMSDGQATAIYKRPWLPETGTEQSFTLNIKVV
jgi:inhibitor of cysteine peptidase